MSGIDVQPRRIVTAQKPEALGRLGKNVREHWPLYIFVLPAFLVVFIFDYIPLYGLQIAFKNYNFSDGIAGSPWASQNGLQHFFRFLTSMDFWLLIRNTLTISIYSLLVGFPFPIFLALMLNQLRNEKLKRIMQTVTYMPHFISIVVMVGMILLFLSPRSGLYGNLVNAFGGEPQNIMGEPQLFSTVYVLSNIWQSTGWNSIIYLAALAGIDPNLYEAARIDGASRFRIIWNIDLPHLAPTMIILLILTTGRVMQVGFEKVYLMQNLLNLPSSEIISTYVYKKGILNQNYSYSTAVGLFNTVVNFIILVTVNKLAKRHSEYSLW